MWPEISEIMEYKDNVIQFPIKDVKRVFAAALGNKLAFENQKDWIWNCNCPICKLQSSTSEKEPNNATD